jgi:UDP-N-acetylglucosamine--N-acetylmuramyl-(pentapeptide) pyrophosphoryl-undecaprenol N-acetylglucosamine transferase
MAAYFGRADLVVCRAGATTLAELIAARKAAILVPFAGAADDHQTWNARELEAVGGAAVLSEAEATPEALAARILGYLDRPADLDAMERNVGRLQVEDPAGRIAALCLALMKRPPKETAA